MLNDFDRARMQAHAAAIRRDKPATITLYRQAAESDDASFDQDVRLCFVTNRPIVRETPQGEQVTIPLLVKGAPDLDIQQGDRFVHDGVAYVIDLVRPDRSVETTAEARVVR